MLKHTRRVMFGLTAAACLLSAAADPIVGTWKMNVAKSKFSPGPAPKSSTTTYTQEGDWLVVKSVGVNSAGEPVNRTNRFKTDGGSYTYTGPNGPGKISVKKVDEHTYVSTTTLDAGGSTVGRSVYSKDGKTRTQTVTGVNSKGEKLNHVIVYERQ